MQYIDMTSQMMSIRSIVLSVTRYGGTVPTHLYTYGVLGCTTMPIMLQAMSCMHGYTVTATCNVLSTVSVVGTTMDTSIVVSNTLTLLNTSLLLTSGVVCVGAVHASTLKTHVQCTGLLMVVVGLATLFLMVQCCEYIHLY